MQDKVRVDVYVPDGFGPAMALDTRHADLCPAGYVYVSNISMPLA